MSTTIRSHLRSANKTRQLLNKIAEIYEQTPENITIEVEGTRWNGKQLQGVTIDPENPYDQIILTPPANTQAGAIIEEVGIASRQLGSIGNKYTVEFKDPGSDDAPLSIELNGYECIVTLGRYSGEFAYLILQDITFKAVQAGEFSFGEDSQVAIVYQNDGAAGSETVEVVENVIIVHMENGGSLPSQIIAALEASEEAMELVSVSLTGYDIVQSSTSTVFLSGGGLSPAYTSTANAVAEIFQKDPTTAPIFNTGAYDGGHICEPQAATRLEGGEDNVVGAGAQAFYSMSDIETAKRQRVKKYFIKIRAGSNPATAVPEPEY